MVEGITPTPAESGHGRLTDSTHGAVGKGSLATHSFEPMAVGGGVHQTVMARRELLGTSAFQYPSGARGEWHTDASSEGAQFVLGNKEAISRLTRE